VVGKAMNQRQRRDVIIIIIISKQWLFKVHSYAVLVVVHVIVLRELSPFKLSRNTGISFEASLKLDSEFSKIFLSPAADEVHEITAL
jgi:galactose-1-phosphate uridylyltransferase